MTTRGVYEVNTRDAMELSRRLAEVLDGHDKRLCEVACVLTYCRVADGVAAYSDASRAQRVCVIIERGTSALADLIVEVGMMSQTDLDAEVLVRPVGRPS